MGEGINNFVTTVTIKMEGSGQFDNLIHVWRHLREFHLFILKLSFIKIAFLFSNVYLEN